MSNEGIRCIIQFITYIARNWRMVSSVVVVEVMYQFEVLIAIQTGVVAHFIDLEFPDFVLIRGRWSSRIARGNICQLYVIFSIWFVCGVRSC